MTQLDAMFFKPFVEGTLHTLKVQCRLGATHDRPFIKGQREQPQFDIAGVLGLTSKTFSGTITLCFPEAVFLAMMGGMLGESFSSITNELQDGAAELLNMIFGHAKQVLNEQGYAIEKAIPTVVRGVALRTTHLSSSKVIVLPFRCPAGEFQIEICSEEKLT